MNFLALLDDDSPTFNIAELKTSVAPMKFKLSSVKVIDFMPYNIADFTRRVVISLNSHIIPVNNLFYKCKHCKVSCLEDKPCIKCGVSGRTEMAFLFSFLLADFTGELPVIFSHEDAVSGMPKHNIIFINRYYSLEYIFWGFQGVRSP
jgi:hypothetical protein